MADFVVVLSSNDMKTLDEALSRYEDSYTFEEWKEMPEARADLDSLNNKLQTTVRSAVLVRAESIEDSHKPDKGETA